MCLEEKEYQNINKYKEDTLEESSTDLIRFLILRWQAALLENRL